MFSEGKTETGATGITKGRGALLRGNSLSSALRAMATSLTTIILPIILVVALPPGTYAIWALISSVAAFTLYFDLGVQAAVLSLVGKADAAAEHDRAVSIGLAGVRVAGAVALAAVVAGTLLGTNLHGLFPDIAGDRVAPAAVTLVLLFIGQGLSLVSTALSAYFGGRQRTSTATRILLPARVAALITTCCAAFLKADLVVLGLAFVLPLAMAAVILIVKFVEDLRTSSTNHFGERRAIRRLLRFSGPLMFWNLCMLVVSGLDLTLVGRLDFSHVGLYAVAATIGTGIAGLENALIAPLLPEMSGLVKMSRLNGARALLSTASRLNALLLLGVVVSVGACAPVLAVLLLPHEHSATVVLVMVVLVAANCIRLTVAPLSLAFVANGTHSRLVVQPMLEAGANVVSSVLLGMVFGAVGVALGTVVGSLVGVLVALTWSTRVAGLGLTSTSQLLREVVGRPLLAWAPGITLLALEMCSPLRSTGWGVVVATCGLLVSLPGVYLLLGHDTRLLMVQAVRSRLPVQLGGSEKRPLSHEKQGAVLSVTRQLTPDV